MTSEEYRNSEARRESMKAARAKYDKVNTKNFGFKLNYGTDLKLIRLLEVAENKQEIIKDALRLYLIRSQDPLFKEEYLPRIRSRFAKL